MQIQRLEVFLVAYVATSLLLALWVPPGHIAALTSRAVSEAVRCRPTSVEAGVHERRPVSNASREPASIIPMSFTFPHAGKLLSMSFVLFAGWFSDVAVPLLSYPTLALGGFFAFFGSLNVAVPPSY